MRKPFEIGCLLSVLCQSHVFGSVEVPSLERIHLSKSSWDISDDNFMSEAGEEIFLAQHWLSFDDEPPAVHARVKNAPVATRELASRIQLGGDYTRVSIKPHGHNTFNGNLGGAQGMYEYRPANNFYGGAKFAWKQGDTHGPGGKRTLFYIDAQERLGYTFAFHDDDWMLTFFSGLGYRHYEQKLAHGGCWIKFRYNELYIPVGGIVDYAVNTWCVVGFGLTWMPQVYPTVRIEPLKGTRWIITSELANFYAQMPITFTLTENKHLSLVLNPFYEYWRDGHSTAKSSSGVRLGLPGNTYNFWGVDLNLAYSF
jgi:hypothetical protein